MGYEINNQVETMSLNELKGFIPQKMRELDTIAANDGLKSLAGESLTDFQKRSEEMDKANTRFLALRAVDEGYQKHRAEVQKSFHTADRNIPFNGGPTGGSGGGTDSQERDQFKSLGQLYTESAPYKALDMQNLNLKVTGTVQSDIQNVTLKSVELANLKATMTTAAGWAPYPTLSPRPPVLTALQKPVVADLIPQDDTTQQSILWYEETTYTENAQPTSEGAVKPEAALGLTLRTQPVIKIAVTLPITDEQLQDVPQIRGYIDQRLTLMLKRAEDAQLLGGSGVAPQLMGFHNKVGIGSIARGATEDNPDAILRAITDVNNIVGFANVSGIIMNPLQWLAIRLLRTKTGEYIWGHPALVGPATLWGLPVVETNAETAGRCLVGDFQTYSHISRRLGIRIDVGYINDDFTRDIQRIRLEERLSLEIYRASAFEEVTNLNQAPTT